MSPAVELNLFRLVRDLAAHADVVGDPERIQRYALRLTNDFFGGAEVCLATWPAGSEAPQVVHQLPREATWDVAELGAFLSGQKREPPGGVLVARVRRRGRVWAALAARVDKPPPGAGPDDWDERDALTAISRIAAGLTAAFEAIDRQRGVDARSRINRKIREQLRPRDLFYQILHALRALTDYDHSSALLLADAGGDFLEIAAEQIAWSKAKSKRIGLRLPLAAALREALPRSGVCGFSREGGVWRVWRGEAPTALAELLAYYRGDDSDNSPREGALLAAPLATRDGLIGVIKLAARHPAALGDFEADVLDQFGTQASVAIQYLQSTESLQSKMLEAEKKHAVANLARGVSHDVNNALGSVLPLVQQMLADVRAGRLDAKVLEEDLAHVERSLQICRRIFGGMLSLARGGRRVGQGNLRRAIEGTLAILEDGMQRRGIRVEVDVPDELPPIRGGQGDLEQLFLNLSTNARDAMPTGGALSVAARPLGDHVEVLIRDTGCGIAEEHLARINEPFFTTKEEGNGLGLAICRSIVWEMRGRMELESRAMEGTKVRVLLPTVDAPAMGAPG